MERDSLICLEGESYKEEDLKVIGQVLYSVHLFGVVRTHLLDKDSRLKGTLCKLSKYIQDPIQLQSIIDIKTLPQLIPFINSSESIDSHSQLQGEESLSEELEWVSNIICSKLYHQNNSKEDASQLIKVLQQYFQPYLPLHLQKCLQIWSNQRLINVLA